jgi:hypothetical protein
VHQALINAATRTNRVLKEPMPFVLQRALNDFYVEYQINAYITDVKSMANIYSDLHQSIQDSFNEAGIEIMSSHYMNLRDGNRSTTPENYLPKDYEKPGFKIEDEKKLLRQNVIAISKQSPESRTKVAVIAITYIPKSSAYSLKSAVSQTTDPSNFLSCLYRLSPLLEKG